MSNKAASKQKHMTRDEIRAAVIGSGQQFLRKSIVIENVPVDIRKLSTGEKGRLIKKITNKQGIAENDTGLLAALACIYCVYEQGTDIKVFEETELDALLDTPCDTFVEKCAAAAMKLNNLGQTNAGDAVGNSDATAGD